MGFDDGAHILYVNGEYRGEDPLGKLMHDFNCADPEEMYYAEFKERAWYFKKAEGGVSIMCKEMEEIIIKAKTEVVESELKKINVIMEQLSAFSGITVEDLDEIRKLMFFKETV